MCFERVANFFISLCRGNATVDDGDQETPRSSSTQAVREGIPGLVAILPERGGETESIHSSLAAMVVSQYGNNESGESSIADLLPPAAQNLPAFQLPGVPEGVRVQSPVDQLPAVAFLHFNEADNNSTIDFPGYPGSVLRGYVFPMEY